MKTPVAILKIALQIVLLVALTGAALATRRHVLDAQRQLVPDGSVAFSLESALAFRASRWSTATAICPRSTAASSIPAAW
jgi:hypothetical protein